MTKETLANMFHVELDHKHEIDDMNV